MIHDITGMISLSKTGSLVFQDKTCTIVLITLQNKPHNHRLEETALSSRHLSQQSQPGIMKTNFNERLIMTLFTIAYFYRAQKAFPNHCMKFDTFKGGGVIKSR